MDPLPEKSTLKGGGYRIIRAMERGVLWQRYAASDLHRARSVWIEEFAPDGISQRQPGKDQIEIGGDYQPFFAMALRICHYEAHALERLSHPGLVQVSEHFLENGTFYRILTMCEGQNLGSLIRETRSSGILLPERQLHESLQSLINGLEALLRIGCYHLDIASGNVLLTASGQCKLLSISNALECLKSNLPYEIPGPLLNPLLHGEKRWQHDLRHLGALLYEMLTGQKYNDEWNRQRLKNELNSANREASWFLLLESSLTSRIKSVDDYASWWGQISHTVQPIDSIAQDELIVPPAVRQQVPQGTPSANMPVAPTVNRYTTQSAKVNNNVIPATFFDRWFLKWVLIISLFPLVLTILMMVPGPSIHPVRLVATLLALPMILYFLFFWPFIYFYLVDVKVNFLRIYLCQAPWLLLAYQIMQNDQRWLWLFAALFHSALMSLFTAKALIKYNK